MSRDVTERRRAFTGLLANPVLDRWRHPELFALVRSSAHRAVLVEWFATRLGYRLVVTESAARLFRLPLHNTVLAPRRVGAPPRRVLVLAILAAAAAEDAEDYTTTQDLSDRVRALAAREETQLAPYDPDRFTERQQFAKAVDLLLGTGALRSTGRDDDDKREGWAHRRDTVGGAYRVERELLLRMVDPAALSATLGERADSAAPEESAARFGVLRRLLELPVCLLDDLNESERGYLAGQRHRILAWCTEMTGWGAEQRAEGIALVAAEEGETDLPFPRLRAVDFATLMVLDQLRTARDADGTVSEDTLDRAVTEVRARHSNAMTKELDTDTAVRDRAVELLRALDMMRRSTQQGRWWLSPAAHRFRDPRVVSVTARFDEDGAQ